MRLSGFINKAGKMLLVATLFVLLVVNPCQPCYAYHNYYELGKKAFTEGDFPTARRYLSVATKRAPNHSKCHYFYAQTLMKLELYEQAQKEYERVIEIAPRSNEANLSAVGISNIEEYYLARRGKINIANKNGYSGRKTAEQRHKIISVGENYIANALDNGLVTRWNTEKMPINLYIQRAGDIPGYQDYYFSSVKRASDDWANGVMADMIKFKLVDNPDNADIKVFFAVKINLASGNNYIPGLATPYTSQNRLIFYEIKLVTQKPDGSQLSENEMHATALHELGHALGIRGHSNKETDIMYSEGNYEAISKGIQLSERDINTITLLYTLDADISNFNEGEIPAKNSGKNEKLLGSTDERLDNELKEAMEYTEKYPDNVLGWTKLGETYANMKNYTNAVTCLQKAVAMDSSYLHAREKLAFTYKEMGDFNSAVEQFKKLVEIESNNINFSGNYALYLVENKHYQEARLVIEALTRQNPDAKNDSRIKKLTDSLDKAP